MFKRLSAIFIALIMCLSLMTPAFAASTTDSDTITIQNVEEGSTLTAYQIIEPVIDSNGNFVGWKWSSAIESAAEDEENPNEALADMIENSTTETKVEVTSGTTNTYNLIKEGGISLANVQTIIAQGVSNLGTAANISFTYNSTTKNYTGTATVGSYLVYVTPGEGQNPIKIYNPMVISVDYSGNEGAVAGGTADGNAVLTIGTDTAYAKSSPVSIEKTVSDETADGKTQRDYSVGDTVNYVITTTIPDYSADYYDPTKLTFTFTDTMDESLDYNSDLKIQKPGEVAVVIPAKEGDITNYTVTTTTDDTTKETIVTVEFESAFIAANPGQKLEILYSAKLNDNATTGYNPNTNTVELTYTNTPTTTTTADDYYRVYTFSINGTYLVTREEGETQDTYYYQNNFLKTGETGATLVRDNDGNPVKDTTTNRNQYTGGLADAVFTLYASDKTTALQTGLTTDAKGYLQVDGLKQGTYYLVETKAPDGYSLNSTPVEIVISASYFENGNLKFYSITIDGVMTESYTLADTYADYEPTQLKDQYIYLGDASAPYVFKNLTLSNLPSTGSYGTYAFILIGCIIMATALTMFVVKRKESK